MVGGNGTESVPVEMIRDVWRRKGRGGCVVDSGGVVEHAEGLTVAAVTVFYGRQDVWSGSSSKGHGFAVNIPGRWLRRVRLLVVVGGIGVRVMAPGGFSGGEW